MPALIRRSPRHYRARVTPLGKHLIREFSIASIKGCCRTEASSEGRLATPHSHTRFHQDRHCRSANWQPQQRSRRGALSARPTEPRKTTEPPAGRPGRRGVRTRERAPRRRAPAPPYAEDALQQRSPPALHPTPPPALRPFGRQPHGVASAAPPASAAVRDPADTGPRADAAGR